MCFHFRPYTIHFMYSHTASVICASDSSYIKQCFRSKYVDDIGAHSVCRFGLYILGPIVLCVRRYTGSTFAAGGTFLESPTDVGISADLRKMSQMTTNIAYTRIQMRMC